MTSADEEMLAEMRLRAEAAWMADDPAHWPVGRLLSAAARLAERRVTQRYAAHGLSHASAPVLYLLLAGPRSQRELAHAMGVTEQSLSRVVARLESLGHIERSPDPTDRRRHLVSLTEQGRLTVAQAREVGAHEHDPLARLSEHEVETLRELLVRVVAGELDDGGHPRES